MCKSRQDPAALSAPFVRAMCLGRPCKLLPCCVSSRGQHGQKLLAGSLGMQQQIARAYAAVATRGSPAEDTIAGGFRRRCGGISLPWSMAYQAVLRSADDDEFDIFHSCVLANSRTDRFHTGDAGGAPEGRGKLHNPSQFSVSRDDGTFPRHARGFRTFRGSPACQFPSPLRAGCCTRSCSGKTRWAKQNPADSSGLRSSARRCGFSC